MVKNISMNVNETLELDYLVEKISDDTINIDSEPKNVSSSIEYISINKGVFRPPDTGTYQLDINGQTVKIDVVDIPDSELDHRYPTDEGSGTNVADTLGSIDFTVNGATWTSGTGRGGYYLDYDSTDDYTEHVDQTNTPFDNSDFSWAAWFNPDSTDEGVILSGGKFEDSESYIVSVGGDVISSGSVGVWVNNGDGGSNIVIEQSASSTEWQFIGVGAQNNDVAALYYALQSDSSVTKVGTQNYDNGLKNPIEAITVGARQNDAGGKQDFYGGGIDHHMANVGTKIGDSVFQDIFDGTKGDYQ